MKSLFKVLLVLFSVLIVSSCASKKANFVTEHEDAWMDGTERGLLYCRGNKEANGLADPICYETKFEEYEDQKKRVEKRKKKESDD